jgi:hypothetical protein
LAGDEEFIKFESDSSDPASASINQLIYWLTSDESEREVSKIASALCLSLTLYCSSAVFFQKLRDRYIMICSETPISKACETTYPVEQWKILCNSGM